MAPLSLPKNGHYIVHVRVYKCVRPHKWWWGIIDEMTWLACCLYQHSQSRGNIVGITILLPEDISYTSFFLILFEFLPVLKISNFFYKQNKIEIPVSTERLSGSLEQLPREMDRLRRRGFWTEGRMNVHLETRELRPIYTLVLSLSHKPSNSHRLNGPVCVSGQSP